MNVNSVSGLPGMAVAKTSQSNIGDIGTAMVSKSIKAAEQSGDALKKMMERSVNPQVGGNFDVFA